MDNLQTFHRLSSQARLLYEQSAITFIFPVIAAPGLCLLLWPVSNPQRLLIWGGITVGYSLLRYGMIWRVGQGEITPANVNRWLDLFTGSVFLSGLLWGAACILLVPYQADRIIEFTIYNSLTMLVVCGLVAGAVVSYSINLWVLLFYAFPALVPPAIYLIVLGDRYNSALGGFVLLYFIFIMASSLRLHRQFSYYLDIEYRMVLLQQKYNELVRAHDEETSGEH